MTVHPALVPLSAVFPNLDRPAPVPLDEALARSRAERQGSAYVQGSLAFDLLPDHALFGPQATSRADLPDPSTWGRTVAQVLAEVMVGLRPPTQLIRWTSPEVYTVIARRSLLVASRRSRRSASTPRPSRPHLAVRRVFLCEPADGVAELSVILQDGGRTRAMAMRLSGFDGRWRVEALQIG